MTLTETEMRKIEDKEKYRALSSGLKIFAVILWIIALANLISILSFNKLINISPTIIPVRADFRWDYELMFAVIYSIWGIFLWKASKNPNKHLLFINFTILTNILHGLIMIFIGIFREGEFLHLLTDGLVLIIPALILNFLKNIEFPQK